MYAYSNPAKPYGYASPLAARVAGAGPHELIAILMDEALAKLEESALLHGRGDMLRARHAAARASSMIDALDLSLDFERGGEMARNLHGVYRHLRDLVAPEATDAARLTKAQAILTEIRAAWQDIGPR